MDPVAALGLGNVTGGKLTIVNIVLSAVVTTVQSSFGQLPVIFLVVAVDPNDGHVLVVLVADLFHKFQYGALVLGGICTANLIVHAHFATAKTRTVPHGQEDWDFFERCMQALREIGYRGCVSFEGGVYDSVVLDGMLAQMKALDVK